MIVQAVLPANAPGDSDDRRELEELLRDVPSDTRFGAWRQVVVTGQPSDGTGVVSVTVAAEDLDDPGATGRPRYVLFEDPDEGWVLEDVVPLEQTDHPRYGVTLSIAPGAHEPQAVFRAVYEMPQAPLADAADPGAGSLWEVLSGAVVSILDGDAAGDEDGDPLTNPFDFGYRLLQWGSADPAIGKHGLWQALSPDLWASVEEDGRPFLLVIHGTGLQTRAGFAGLGPAFFDQMAERYAAVVAFDHPTVRHTPRDNWRWFCQKVDALLPPGAHRLSMDILTMSRGALIGRAVAEDLFVLPRVSLDVRKLVMLVPPNDGTPTSRFRLCSLLYLNDINRQLQEPNLPPLPWVKVSAEVPSGGNLFRGGRVQQPGSSFLRLLNQRPHQTESPGKPDTRYHVVAARPPDHLWPELRDRARQVFGDDDHDFIVPTTSAYNPVVCDALRTPHRFPVGGVRERLVVAVDHRGVVCEEDTRQRLLEWLDGSDDFRREPPAGDGPGSPGS